MEGGKSLLEIFVTAAEIEDPLARAAYLGGACGSDESLRRRVEALLAVEEAEGTPPAATPGETLGPGSRIGAYTLCERIGEGGCGIVYLAEQEEPVRRRVALKVIKLGMDTGQVLARFEAERQALAMMDHPGIARVYEAGASESGRPFFAMELVRGLPLTDYCDQEQLGMEDRLRLFEGVCQAVQHAHQKGIIHRDLKPSNVLVTEVDGSPQPKIIDFGIAKAMEGRLTDATLFTAFEQLVGTPSYMSPEQASMVAADIDTRSDIYSLGVLLYELLTGAPPFNARDLLESGLDRMRRIIGEDVPARPSNRLRQLTDDEITTVARSRRSAPPRLIDGIAGDLDWIVMKCLEKDRSRRYGTASGLAEDIRRHLRHEPVQARPPSRLYHFQKSFQRHRAAFVAAGAVMAAVAVGFGVAAWQFGETSRALQRATDAESEQSRLRREAETRAEDLRWHSYAADMNAANRALDLGDLGALRRLLDRHRPADGQVDLRGWEWRFLWRQARSEAEADLLHRASPIISLSTSSDGRWLAAGTAHAGGLVVVDLHTPGSSITLSPESERVLAAFSPRDPLLAFTAVAVDERGERHGTLQLWDTERQRPLGSHRLDHECVGLVFSADGAELVTSTSLLEEGTITRWRMPDCVPLDSFPSEQFGGETWNDGFAATSDLGLAAYALRDRVVRVIDLRDGGGVLWEKEVVPKFVTALEFSPNGRTLAIAAGFEQSDVRLWGVETSWKIEEPRELRSFKGHGSFVTGIEFTPDGGRMITGSADRTVGVWDVASGRRLDSFSGHELGVLRVHLMPDGETFVSGASDGTVLSWALARRRTRAARRDFPRGMKDWSFSADSRSVITVDANGQVVRWSGGGFDVPTPLFEFDPASMPPRDRNLSDDGRRVAVTSAAGVVTVVDLDEPRRRIGLRPGARSLDRPAHFLSSRWLVGAHDDLEFSVWEAGTGESVYTGPMIPNVVSGYVCRARNWIVQLSFDRRLQRISFPGCEVTDLRLDFREAENGAFSPDGGLFAVASRLGYVRVWDTGTWEEVRTLRGFLSSRDGVAFSPDGSRLLASGGEFPEEAFRLFDTASWLDVLTLPCEGSNFILPRFSPDGNAVGMMSATRTLTVWQAPTWDEIAVEEAGTGGWRGHRPD